MELLLHQWGDLPELYRNTDKTEATEIVIIDSQMNYRGKLDTYETDEDIARYSVLHDNNRLFMSKYLTYLPTKEQLKQEIERQKAVFYMQHPLQIEDGGE